MKLGRKKIMRNYILGILVVHVLSMAGFAQAEKPMLFRQPTMNKTDIVFAFAGDLWKVSRSGGSAERLTSGTGTESNPRLSPDGNWIAFTGEYDGNVDVFVIPATGVEPRRITYHPGADTLIDWTPDGKSVVVLPGRAPAMP